MSSYDEVKEKLSADTGSVVKGAAIRSPNSIYVLFENKYEAAPFEYVAVPRTSILHHRPSTENQWAGMWWDSPYNCQSTILSDKEKTFMAVSATGDIFSQQQNESSFKESYDNGELPPVPNPDNNTSFRDMVEIAGEVYVAGTGNELFRQNDKGDWDNLSRPALHPVASKDTDCSGEDDDDFEDCFDLDVPKGFDAVDGFSRDEIYAVGDDGECSFYDGKQWRLIDLQIKQADLTSVCCAPNGKVYIGGQVWGGGGVLFEGRHNKWKKYDSIDQPFSDIVALCWFKNRLYIASQGLGGLCSFSNGQFTDYDYETAKADSSLVTKDKTIAKAMQYEDGLIKYTYETAKNDPKDAKYLPTSPTSIQTLHACDELMVITNDHCVYVFDGIHVKKVFDMEHSEETLRETGELYEL